MRHDPIAVVAQAERADEEIIAEAKEVDRQEREAPWKIGRLASEWCQKGSHGRSDAKFAKLCGLDGEQVRQRRAVFQRFGESSNTYWNLSWSHCYAALTWDDAESYLASANEHGWSVAEMKRHRDDDQYEDELEDESNEEVKSTPAPKQTSKAKEKPTKGKGRAVQRSLIEEPEPEAESEPERTFTLSELRGLVEAAEEATKESDRKKLAAWHRKRADALDPKKKRGGKFEPPTIEEVQEYVAERGNKVDVEAWFAHYESNGWRVGRNPMKDWKAAVRTWERSEVNGGAFNGTRTKSARKSVARVRATESFNDRQEVVEVSGENAILDEEDLPF